MQTPEIVEIKARKLVGMRQKMSITDNKVRKLWQQFMPRRKEIINKENGWLYSVAIYDKKFNFDDFTPHTEFERWVAVEVTDFDQVPEGMETHVLSGGKYAMFIHKGPAHTFPETFQYIFKTWLPDSGYKLDKREHFEIMDEDYPGPNDPSAEEQIWIPIK